ncbi:MAG TPA: MmgE/PrpD family protein [Pseudolabrys sp.]|jgi:2-methylcitrate dehydratase PrpD
MSQSTIAPQLADFIAGFDLAAVPASAQRRAKHLFLDSLGVALASSSFDFGKRAARGLRAVEAGTTPVIGLTERLTLKDAALVNGILVHGLDYDDTSIYGRVHPSSFCATTAFTLGGHRRQSGADVLAAYIAGLECSVRIGSIAKGGFQKKGFHPTGIVASFGAALVASRLMKLTAEQIAMAQGIAYATASGNQEFAATMAWTKRMHPGWGAAGGITSAALASEGFTGPPTPYEGKFGLYPLYLGGNDWDYGLATKELGQTWLVEGISMKPLPACYFNVPLIDAMSRIVAEHEPAPADIERIEVLIPEAAINTVCEPRATKSRPADSYAAQFSAYYVVASTLGRGRFSLDDLSPESLSDPAILSIVDKVHYAVDPKTTFPQHYAGAVVVRMKDGRIFEAREDVDRGSPKRPLTEKDVLEKFAQNAARSSVSANAQRIADTVMSIEKLKDTNELATLLSPA